MLCQRPLEVLSYWSLRTYRMIRSKISCKLFRVMQFPLHFTNLQENLPKTPAPCVNSSSLTVEQQNASPCGPIQLVNSLLIQRNQLLEPTPTNADCGKKPRGFPLCVRDELKRCPFSSLEFGGLSVAFAIARVIVEWDEKEPYLYHLEWSLGLVETGTSTSHGSHCVRSARQGTQLTPLLPHPSQCRHFRLSISVASPLPCHTISL